MDKQKNSTIYAIRCKENGKVYVGRTTDVKKRFRSHISKMRSWSASIGKNLSGKRHVMQDDYDKYGEESIELYILEENVPPEKATGRELYWMRRYNSGNPQFGYNKISARAEINLEVGIKAGRPPEPIENDLAENLGCDPKSNIPDARQDKNVAPLESWIADVVGVSHIYGIRRDELAAEAHRETTYVSGILNGKWPAEKHEKMLKGALLKAVSKKWNPEYVIEAAKMLGYASDESEKQVGDVCGYKNLRLRSGLSQQQVVNQLGVHQTAVSNWEKGKNHPNASLLVRIANLYQCAVEDLVQGNPVVQSCTTQTD